MCELLGMNCNVPTDIVFSFRGFARRGGGTAPHADGWGISFYEGKAARIFREPTACVDSRLAEYVRDTSIKTCMAVAHIRKKTRGNVKLANTHPFQRELWGRTWTFAHNGKVHGVFALPLGRFRPVGTTDSEHAFCWLLDQIATRFDDYPKEPSKIWKLIAELGATISEFGTFNLLLTDGTFLYARCHTKLHHIVRKHPFAQATLSDEDFTIDFSDHTTPRDRVAVIATEPLTKNEVWVRGEPGTLWVFSAGALRATLTSPLLNKGTNHGDHRRSEKPRNRQREGARRGRTDRRQA
jgi:predicted glutamine amidotransferase